MIAPGASPHWGMNAVLGINGDLTHPPRPRHILRQVEVMCAGRAGRFRDAGCQMERAGIEHGELPMPRGHYRSGWGAWGPTP